MRSVAKYQPEDQLKKVKTNEILMCINLIIYIISILAYSSVFSLVVAFGTSLECKAVISQDIVYCFSQMSFCSRILISCYMNLRYSRPFDECKRQFVLLFSSDSTLRKLQNHSSEGQEEVLERTMFDRRHQFY